jgi:hypothetical protein
MNFEYLVLNLLSHLNFLRINTMSVKSFFILLIAASTTSNLLGQASTPSNSGVNTDYLGWNSSVGDPLKFEVFNGNNFDFKTAGTSIPYTLADDVFVIGLGNTPFFGSKLWVRINGLDGNIKRGIYSEMATNQGAMAWQLFGGRIVVRGTTEQQRAVEGRVFTGFSQTGTKIGIQGKLCKAKGYAIFARVDTNVPDSWAGWFDGDVWRAGSWLPLSDYSLKNSIEPISSSLDLILSFQPKQYQFRVEEFPSLHLSEGIHYGFIAQDVEEFLPELVSEGKSATKYNEEGDIEYDPIEFKVLSYFEIIPIIVGALNDRENQISEQIALIQQLEEAIALLEAQQEE